MRRVTRCERCQRAAWRAGIGFTATDALVCLDREEDVGPDDGCTFGEPGEPGRAVCGYDVDILAYKAALAEGGDW